MFDRCALTPVKLVGTEVRVRVFDVFEIGSTNLIEVKTELDYWLAVCLALLAEANEKGLASLELEVM